MRKPHEIAYFTNCIYNIHRCQHQRTKKRDSADQKAKERELVFFTPLGGAYGTVVRRLDDTRILPELR